MSEAEPQLPPIDLWLPGEVPMGCSATTRDIEVLSGRMTTEEALIQPRDFGRVVVRKEGEDGAEH